MRCHWIGLGLLVATAAVLSAAEKDTPSAEKTRNKKLATKVTVDFKEAMLEEAFKDISGQLEDAGAGSLSVHFAQGVSKNQRVNFAAKDTPLATVLDGMLKKNGLGYVVTSKAGDRYDGWLFIKQGSERGFAAAEEPKPGKDKAVVKAPPKDKPAPPVAGDDAAEKAASNKLGLALDLLKDGKTDKAKQRLKDIVENYPNTKAAGEAKKTLEKLNP
jgi:TolA-binding protein